MLSKINSLLKKIIYPGQELRAFIVTRLSAAEIKEKVFIKNNGGDMDITGRHSMTCLDPFSMAVWVTPMELASFNPSEIQVIVKRQNKTRSALRLTLAAQIDEHNTIILIYRLQHSRSYQGNRLFRFITLAWFLKNATSTYKERRSIAAFYAYPRKVIVISYRNEDYFNMFPMDIQGHVSESNLYLLGLRHSNITLEKILLTKKLVIADSSRADIKTIYSLGRHFSKAPPKPEELPFVTSESSLFKFPVPGFSSAYKEVEIIKHINLGYHMLLIGKIVNAVQLREDDVSLYHIHFFEFAGSGYKSISNAGYS